MAEDINGQERRRVRRGDSSLWGAVILILVGGYFLLQQTGLIRGVFNWWALFILIPAVSSLAAAWAIFRANDYRLNAAVVSPAGGGAVILTVALMFLLNLDWGIYWPLMIVVPGLTMLLSGLVSLGSGEPGSAVGVLVNMSTWFGLAASLLGLTFLFANLGQFDPAAFVPGYNWWAIFIAIPGIGALLGALQITIAQRRFSGGAMAMLISAVVTLVVAAVALIATDDQTWNLITPAILVGVGVIVLVNALIRR